MTRSLFLSVLTIGAALSMTAGVALAGSDTVPAAQILNALKPKSATRGLSAGTQVDPAASAKEARWEPGGASLLELAESRGLNPEFSCRGGSCGTCRTRLVSGQVHYLNMPAELPVEGEVLICCAVPAESEEPLVLEL